MNTQELVNNVKDGFSSLEFSMDDDFPSPYDFLTDIKWNLSIRKDLKDLEEIGYNTHILNSIYQGIRSLIKSKVMLN